MEKSKIIRGTSKCARFFVCDTTEIVREAKKIHDLDPIATTIFGKLLTATAMMGKDLKNEKDLVSVRINGDGPYGNMLATGNMNGEVKGYIANPEEKFHQIVDENGNFIKDETGQIRFIGNGTMQVIKDLGLRDPFSGVTQINEEDIADIVAHYFLLSEQIKSVVALGVKLDENGEVKRAGGYLIQLLPGVEDGFIDKLENKLLQIRTITELLEGGMSLEQIVELLYEDISVFEDETDVDGAHKKVYVEDFEILEKSDLEYKCNCTRDKFYRGLITLGKDEINKILEEEGKIETECHFCRKKYEFTKDVLIGISYKLKKEMKKMSKLRVGVIRGGVSTEREVSLKTGSEIVANLNRDKYEVFDIVIDTEKEVYEKIKDLNLDFAYIALHGVFGEDGRIQAILQSLGIAYSGPGVMSSAVCMDKEFSKRIVSEYGVRIAKWKSVRVGETVDFETVKKELGDHLIVKPNNGGSSIGVSFVETEEELKKGLELVFGMDKEALIEEVLHGVEISVPVIGGKVFPTIRIEALAGDYFDYESKYAKGGAKEYVFEFPEKVQAEINKFAQDSYYGLKCEGFARIDFMVVNEETPYFMEVNTSPGMTAASLLPKSTASKGYSYSETLDLLIESSLKVER